MKIFKNIFRKKEQSKSENLSINQIYERNNNPDFDNCNKYGDISWIFDYVLKKDDIIALKAAQTIHRLFQYGNIYRNKLMYANFKYIKINIQEIDVFDKFQDDIKITLLCIATQNGNGYIREIALRKLIEIQNDTVFPFIVFRLADWVKVISNIAEQAIYKLITQKKIELFIKHHKLINWFLKVERKDLSKLHIQITKLISENQLDKFKIKKLQEGERFFYFKRLFKNKSINKLNLELATQDKYYLIRLLVIKNIELTNDKEELIKKYLKDKSIKVRQATISLIKEKDVEFFKSDLLNLIFDNSASIRNKARKLLKKQNELDFHKIYRQAIIENSNLFGAILGLSEIGTKNDIDLINKHQSSSNANIRFATIMATYSLDNQNAKEKAYEILENDISIKVKKTGEYILSKEGVEINRLRKIYDNIHQDAKGILLRMYYRYGGWSIAGDYLKAIAENEEKLKEKAEIYLQAWERYSIKLAIQQTIDDKVYVMKWYEKAKQVSNNVSEIIPFIFEDK